MTSDELVAMEASGEMPVPDIFFDRALDYIGGLTWKHAERARRARDN